jgi:hypothetical protein
VIALPVKSRTLNPNSGREEDAMKFMFMIYHDEHVLDALPEGEMQVLIDSALDYDEEIRQSGHYIVSNALQSFRAARTILVRGGTVSTTDGPFAETKEQLGGFSLIEAKDMDKVVRDSLEVPAGARRNHRSPPGAGADALVARTTRL